MEAKLLKCLLIRNDLEEAAVEVRNKGLYLAIAHLKTAFIAFHNLSDFESAVRFLYKDHRELSAGYAGITKAVEFFSYLRNKFTGHLTDELLHKAIEWKPELVLTLDREHDASVVLIYNFWILETAINSYVDPNENHKIFDSETDFNYPPNKERFVETLLIALDGAVAFLKSVEAVLKTKVTVPENNLDLWKKAGLTDFAYIKGKKR
ncbi:hypothetical protein E0I74_15140 [Rhizobium laguerreae]|uniref:hypothetical protein n=1 Tax=Rhizobium laguerreae TaxID=1076926 RepID=UPI00103E1A5F|nr:hypothetical protein [Rhizobium laguerreae]TBX78052.1 hypothetical protein E0I74_15140 [Rhizobium laguerreae]